MSNLLVPMFCPVCDVIMKGSRSNRTFYDFGCCMDCHIEFVEGREQRWTDGWRPTSEQVAIFIGRLSGRDDDTAT